MYTKAEATSSIDEIITLYVSFCQLFIVLSFHSQVCHDCVNI